MLRGACCVSSASGQSRVKADSLWIALLVLAWAASVGSASAGPILRVPLADAIGPATAAFWEHSLEHAEQVAARVIVFELDTPGGLDASMRRIIKATLASSVPVVVFVGPSGARAASAGMFIALSAPLAVMAPGTSIGAAHPVGLGGGSNPADSVMTRKVTNDAAAYARSLAERRGRNAVWAERAVRESVSFSAEEAARDSVVDAVVAGWDELLVWLEGRSVRTVSGEHVLQLRECEVVVLTMGFRERALALLSNPGFAYLLLLTGMLGLGLEFYHPGSVLPGTVGAISLVLAFYAMQSLPIRAAGVLLLVLSMVLFLLEIKVPSFGILSIGGAASLFLGSLFLFETGSAVRLSLGVILPAVLVVTAVFVLAVWAAIQAQKRPVVSGAEALVGSVGQAVTALEPDGRIFVRGEYWNARASCVVAKGVAVRVRGYVGLQLEVDPLGASGDPTSPGRDT